MVGREKLGNYCLMSTELQFGMMNKFWKWIVVVTAQDRECT